MQGVPPELRDWVWMEVSGANQRRQQHHSSYFAAMARMAKHESPFVHQIELVGSKGPDNAVRCRRHCPLQETRAAAKGVCAGHCELRCCSSNALEANDWLLARSAHASLPSDSWLGALPLKALPHLCSAGPAAHLPRQCLDPERGGTSGAASGAERVCTAQAGRGVLPGAALPPLPGCCCLNVYKPAFGNQLNSCQMPASQLVQCGGNRLSFIDISGLLCNLKWKWDAGRVLVLQGMNYIAALLLLAMGRNEEKAFWLMASLIDDESEGG